MSDLLPELHSERLVCRPYRLQDAAALHTLWTAPDFRRYLFDDEVMPMDFVKGEINSTRELFRIQGYGQFGIFLKLDDTLIGISGYRHFFDPPELQLIYGLDVAHWGKGLATEAADLLIWFGFAHCGFERIIAATDVPNQASYAVMKRLGMQEYRRQKFAESAYATVWCDLAKDNWKPLAGNQYALAQRDYSDL